MTHTPFTVKSQHCRYGRPGVKHDGLSESFTNATDVVEHVPTHVDWKMQLMNSWYANTYTLRLFAEARKTRGRI